MIKTLAIEPLTKAAFRPFGAILERADAEVRIINDGTTDRLHALASVDVATGEGLPIVSLFVGRRRPFPLDIAMLERHPLGSQMFFPLQPLDWLVVVGSRPEAEGPPQLRCFHATGHQGVSYARNVWHHPLLVLAPTQDFLVVDREGPGLNCEEIDMRRWPTRIELPTAME